MRDFARGRRLAASTPNPAPSSVRLEGSGILVGDKMPAFVPFASKNWARRFTGLLALNGPSESFRSTRNVHVKV